MQHLHHPHEKQLPDSLLFQLFSNGDNGSHNGSVTKCSQAGYRDSFERGSVTRNWG